MVHDPASDRLTTIASRGYDVVGVGSEVRIGEGVIGKVAESRRRCGSATCSGCSRTCGRCSRPHNPADVPTTIDLPGLADARSQVAAPMVADGVLMGVIAAESERALAFDESAELVLAIAAQLVAGALERAEIIERIETAEAYPTTVPPTDAPARPIGAERPTARLRHYLGDGSTFIDDEYIIKGVAGRLLWKLASEHAPPAGRRTPIARCASIRPSRCRASRTTSRAGWSCSSAARGTRRAGTDPSTGRGRFDVVVGGDARVEPSLEPERG